MAALHVSSPRLVGLFLSLSLRIVPPLQRPKEPRLGLIASRSVTEHRERNSRKYLSVVTHLLVLKHRSSSSQMLFLPSTQSGHCYSGCLHREQREKRRQRIAQGLLTNFFWSGDGGSVFKMTVIIPVKTLGENDILSTVLPLLRYVFMLLHSSLWY